MPQDDEKKLCFVIGPLGDKGTAQRTHADWLLKGIIEPVFGCFPQFRVERSDQIASPGMIDSQVINRLLEAQLVIADLSFQNANAFYELGIRHLKRLPVIHMCLENHKLPFDVLPYRTISFKLGDPDDLEVAKTTLNNTVHAVLEPGFVVENPVTRARGIEKLDVDEHTMPGMEVLRSEIAELRALVQRTARHRSIAK